MSKKVIILGANGRFGRAASEAFSAAGWTVRTFTRNLPDPSDQPEFERFSGDAFDADILTVAARGCDVIVNALNPPYQNWKRDLPRLTNAVIATAKATGGTIILRGGDFIERAKTGNWFDTYIANKAARGKITYPGPLDRVHAWAYLPDMARAMTALADKRGELGPFTTFGFEGINLTGADLVAAIEQVYGRKMKVSNMPWPVMRALGWFIPSIREVMEMRYLWQVPHAISGQALHDLVPELRATPLEVVLKDAMGVDELSALSNDTLISV